LSQGFRSFCGRPEHPGQLRRWVTIVHRTSSDLRGWTTARFQRGCSEFCCVRPSWWAMTNPALVH
jgi:hypothetical protein